MTWDEYTNMLKNKQEKPFITPDGYTITNRSDKLRSDPKAMTWKMYTNMLAENERLANRYKVLPDGAVISQDVDYLREHPDAMTWNEYTR